MVRVNDDFDMIGPEFYVSAHNLVRTMMRLDGRFEMRGVEVDAHDSVSAWDSDRAFVDEYLVRPLKRVSVGDEVFVVPDFKTYVVLGGTEDGLGMKVVRKEMVGRKSLIPPLVVNFGDVRVLQKFIRRCGSTTDILLLPDYRGVSP